MTGMAHIELTAALTAVLYREARLLDEGHFEDWLQLLAPDVVYRAPVIADVAATEPPPAGLQLMYFDDTLPILQVRVGKMRTGFDQAEIGRAHV